MINLSAIKEVISELLVSYQGCDVDLKRPIETLMMAKTNLE